MADQPPRTSERSNKGVPPKRFDMDPPGGTNSVAPSASTSGQQLPANTVSPVPQSKSSQPSATPPDIYRVLADMQKAMMKQITSVNTNLNGLISAQREETKASIATLQQEIHLVAQKVNTGGRTISVVNDGEVLPATGAITSNVNSAVNYGEVLPAGDTASPVLASEMENGESFTNQSSRGQGSTSVKAKKIYPLPKFSGLPEEWPSFFEDFQQTTNEFEYTPLQNIIRIREALHGPAKETVESLLSSSKNVSVIIEILAESYVRPEQLIRSQIDKVSVLEHVPEGKLNLLVQFSTKVTNMVRFLETANGQHHLNNPTLLGELVSKLPPTKQMQWAEKCITLNRPGNLADFAQWLDGIRKIIHMVTDGLPTSSSSLLGNKSSSSHSTNKKQQPVKKYALTTNVVKQCLICSGNCSVLTDCQVFKDASVDERWKKARELRVCFSCLKGHHQVGKCFKKQRCGINGCEKQHNPLLHATDNQNSKQTKDDARVLENVNPRQVVNLHAAIEKSEILFQMIPVKLYGPKKSITIYAFIDDGADSTMLEWDIGKQIGLAGKQEKVTLQWLYGHCSSRLTETVDVCISGSQRESTMYKILKISLVKNLGLPTQSLLLSDINRNSHLAELPISEYNKITPQMVISLKHAYLTVPIEIPMCPNINGPIAVRTRLGWVIYGPTGEENKQVVQRVFISKRQKADDHMDQMMRQYFEIESVMVKLDAEPVIPKGEERALDILKSTIKFCDENYECGLLWKNETRSFPDSYPQAQRRLHLIEKKFLTNPKFEIEYRTKMQHLIDEGYARRLTSVEESSCSASTFFLPHFAVFNPSKDSLRLVFDAAAKVQGVSLNDFLLPGPDLNQPLIAVLLKFREQPIAVCGDLKEMFLQVAIRKEDQDSQRFLYRHKTSQPINQYVMSRVIFGAACSPTIAQFVKNTNAEKYKISYPRATEAILKRHYVDDYADCFSSSDEAIQVVENVVKIHKAGGFTMHKIVSNSAKVNLHFGNPNVNNINLTSGNVEKILGMQWSPVKDEFVFDLHFKRVSVDILENKRTPTKREVLSLIMSVFDPFGFLCDFTISGKIFMQCLWKRGLDWDDEIPEALHDRWNSWICGLIKVRDFRIPRCYFSNFYDQEKALHIFCDASEAAMAVVAYWRIDSPEGPKVSFVAGKTNCAPSKFMSIPRLELQAAVMAVRLKNAIVKHHNIQPTDTSFWTDSSTVVKWLVSDHRRYKQFVANRVAEILESSEEKQWRWVPGEMNPADDGTRASPSYNPNGRWKNGPEFLFRLPVMWPSNKTSVDDVASDEELRGSHYVLSTRVTNINIFNVERFSKYRRLQRCIGWVYRYVNNLNFKCKQLPPVKGDLSLEEEEQAERFIMRSIQQAVFADEYSCILNKEPVSTSSPIKALNPYIDEFNNLRCSGRIDNAPLISFFTKRPYILPKNHPVTRLLVQRYHELQKHINDGTVICELRLKYWIPSIRVVLNSVKAACSCCKLKKCKPVQPIMGPLPVDRLSAFVRPFSYTGLDYFGPVMVAIRRSHEKRWVSLFTCLTTRAVHLELATDLSSDSCLVCIRNFINRRGVPVQIRSDNGTNFVGIPKELANEENFIDFENLDAGLKPLGIKWKFNTPSDPSAGGSWERLVQSVKKALYATLKEKILRPETLYSLLVECENIVNSRPLTHLPITPEEPEPLTPNHFLLGCTNSTQTPAPFNPRCVSRKQWRILQNLKNYLWKRWMLEFLPELTRRTKWCRPAKPIATGALVLICETELPRSKWKRGRVINLIIGKDGVARSAEVKTSTGTLRRPVSKLALLDVEDCGEVNLMGSIHGGGDVGNAGHL